MADRAPRDLGADLEALKAAYAAIDWTSEAAHQGSAVSGEPTYSEPLTRALQLEGDLRDRYGRATWEAWSEYRGRQYGPQLEQLDKAVHGVRAQGGRAPNTRQLEAQERARTAKGLMTGVAVLRGVGKGLTLGLVDPAAIPDWLGATSGFAREFDRLTSESAVARTAESIGNLAGVLRGPRVVLGKIGAGLGEFTGALPRAVRLVERVAASSRLGKAVVPHATAIAREAAQFGILGGAQSAIEGGSFLEGAGHGALGGAAFAAGMPLFSRGANALLGAVSPVAAETLGRVASGAVGGGAISAALAEPGDRLRSAIEGGIVGTAFGLHDAAGTRGIRAYTKSLSTLSRERREAMRRSRAAGTATGRAEALLDVAAATKAINSLRDSRGLIVALANNPKLSQIAARSKRDAFDRRLAESRAAAAKASDALEKLSFREREVQEMTKHADPRVSSEAERELAVLAKEREGLERELSVASSEEIAASLSGEPAEVVEAGSTKLKTGELVTVESMDYDSGKAVLKLRREDGSVVEAPPQTIGPLSKDVAEGRRKEARAREFESELTGALANPEALAAIRGSRAFHEHATRLYGANATAWPLVVRKALGIREGVAGILEGEPGHPLSPTQRSHAREGARRSVEPQQRQRELQRKEAQRREFEARLRGMSLEEAREATRAKGMTEYLVSLYGRAPEGWPEIVRQATGVKPSRGLLGPERPRPTPFVKPEAPPEIPLPASPIVESDPRSAVEGTVVQLGVPGRRDQVAAAAIRYEEMAPQERAVWLARMGRKPGNALEDAYRLAVAEVEASEAARVGEGAVVQPGSPPGRPPEERAAPTERRFSSQPEPIAPGEVIESIPLKTSTWPPPPTPKPLEPASSSVSNPFGVKLAKLKGVPVTATEPTKVAKPRPKIPSPEQRAEAIRELDAASMDRPILVVAHDLAGSVRRPAFADWVRRWEAAGSDYEALKKLSSFVTGSEPGSDVADSVRLAVALVTGRAPTPDGPVAYSPLRLPGAQRGSVAIPKWGDVLDAARAVFRPMSRGARRAAITAHNGDAEQAAQTTAYRLVPALRPDLGIAFREKFLKATMDKLVAEGLSPKHADALLRAERGESVAEINEAVYPELSRAQVAGMLAVAQGRALMVADSLGGASAFAHYQQFGKLRAVIRDWANGGGALAREKDFAYLKSLGKKGDVGAVERLIGELDSITSSEFAQDVATHVMNMKTRVRAFENALGSGRKLLVDLRRHSTDASLEGLIEGKMLKQSDLDVFDALDGYRRVNGGIPLTKAEVDARVARKAAEYNDIADGLGRKFSAAVQVYRNLYNEIRLEYKDLYGKDLADAIGEWLYAPHIWARDPSNPDMVMKSLLEMPRPVADPIKSKIHARFERYRSGAEGFIPDIETAGDLYFKAMITKMGLDRMSRSLEPLIHGKRESIKSWAGRGFSEIVRDGAIADTGAARRFVNEINRSVARTNELQPERATLTLSAEMAQRIKDVDGKPLKPHGDTRSEYDFLLKSALKIGDRVIYLHEMGSGTREFAIPIVQGGANVLGPMRWMRGGLQELARNFGQPGRLKAGLRYLERVKGGKRGWAYRMLENQFASLFRDLSYHRSLGFLNVAAAANNMAGGLAMLGNYLGPEGLAKAIAMSGKVMAAARRGRRGHGYTSDPLVAEIASALERSGVIERREEMIESGAAASRSHPLGFALDVAGRATQAFADIPTLFGGGPVKALRRLGGGVRSASRAKAVAHAEAGSFMLFTGAEQYLRTIAFVGGYARFRGHAHEFADRFFAQHGLGEVVVREGGTYSVDGVALEGGDTLASMLDGVKIAKVGPRKLSKADVVAELTAQSLHRGLASVAKTQFLYDTFFTPELFQTPFGRIVFQLNQYPIRSAYQLFDAIRHQRDPRRVARWIAISIALGVAGNQLDMDLTSMLGGRPADLPFLRDWSFLRAEDNPIADFLREDVYAPTPIPFTRGAPPAVELASALAETMFSAIGLDPKNPLPEGDDLASRALWRARRAFETTSRRTQTAIVPTSVGRVLEFARADVDPETGRRLVRYSDAEGYSPMSLGEFAIWQFLPGSPKSLFAGYAERSRSELRQAEANAAARIYREDLAMRDVTGDEMYASHAEKIAERWPEVTGKTSQRGVARILQERDLPRSIVDMKRGGVSRIERARQWLAWLEREPVGSRATRDAARYLWGATTRDMLASAEGIEASGYEQLAARVRGSYRRAMRGD